MPDTEVQSGVASGLTARPQTDAAVVAKPSGEQFAIALAALEQIAHPPYGLGFNKLRGIARKALIHLCGSEDAYGARYGRPHATGEQA